MLIIQVWEDFSIPVFFISVHGECIWFDLNRIVWYTYIFKGDCG